VEFYCTFIFVYTVSIQNVHPQPLYTHWHVSELVCISHQLLSAVLYICTIQNATEQRILRFYFLAVHKIFHESP